MKNYNFNINHSHEELQKRAISGGSVSISSQFIKLLVQFGTVAILGRLLTPHDFGLVAMVATITGFIAVFRDLGLSQASIQNENVTHNQVSNLFWVNVWFGVGFALVVAALSPLVGIFFNEKDLVAITIVSSLSLVIGGLSVQHQSLLRRALRFNVLALIDVVSRVLGSLIAIVWAYYTRNYWSLVCLQMLVDLIYCIGVWVACNWRPGAFKRNSGTKGMLIFGRNMTHYGIVNYFARNSDNLIVGKVGGPVPLGYYSRAYTLMLLPISQLVAPLTGVMVPVLSRLQNDDEQYKKSYLFCVEVLALLSFPLVSLMFLLSSEIIDIMLGKQWGGAKPIFAILCFAAFWQPILNSTGWVMTSLNRTKRMLHWGYINSGTLVLVFLIGSIWSAYGVSIGYSIYMWLILVPYLAFVLKDTPVKVMDVLRMIAQPLLFNIALVVMLFFAKKYVINSFSLPLRVICISLLFGVFSAGFIFLNKRRRALILDFVKKRNKPGSAIEQVNKEHSDLN